MEKVVVEISAPGKCILTGEHSVVYGHLGIALAIPLRLRGEIWREEGEEEKKEGEIELETKGIGWEEKKYLIEGKNSSCPKDALHQRILSKYEQLRQWLGNLPPGRWHVVINSEIPMGKGLGSSAAFNVVFTAIYLWITNLSSISPPSAFTANQLELIREYSLELEKVEHGNPSGIDNYLATYGGLCSYRRTSIGSRKSGEQLGEKRGEQLGEKRGEKPEIGELSEGAQNRVGKLYLGLVDSGIERETGRAVEHVRRVVENEEEGGRIVDRIGKISEEIRENLEGEGSGWEKKLLSLLRENHAFLRKLGLSNSKMEEIVEQFDKMHHCAKITGAGMGGYLLVVSTESLDSSVQTVGLERKGVQIRRK